jgi:two-component sensor histidine kinase
MAPQLADVALETIPVVDPRDAAAEANHRIANHLAILAGYVRSQLSSFSPETIPDVLSIRCSLQQLSLRIDAIGRLHRLLTSSPHGTNVEICVFLREVADAVRCSLPLNETPKVSFLFDTKVQLPAKQAVVIGAIVSEALFNSAKHAHPQGDRASIRIGCRRSKPDKLLIEIEDDGIAWQHDHLGKGRRDGGAGSQLMRTLAFSLSAELEFVHKNPGYTVRFEQPLSDQPSQ